MGHIQGKNYPLIGVANNVADDATPSITMSNASALIEVTVTNSLTEALTVTEINLESSDSVLVGTFYIDFSGNPAAPSFTPSGAGYVSKTANLTVEGGEAIANGSTAKFYLAIKPYTMLSEQTLNVTVHGTTSSGSGTQVKEISSESPVVFHAGKIKKIAINYSTDVTPSLPEPTEKTGWFRVENASWLANGDRVIIVANAADSAMSTTQNTNNRGVIRVTKTTDEGYQKVIIDSDVQQFILEDSTAVSGFFFWNDNGDNANKYIYAASSSSNYLKSQVERTPNGFFSVNILAGGAATISAQGTNTHNLIRFNKTLFSCYVDSNTGTDIAIYKYYGGSTPTCANPVITQEASTVSISTTTPGASIYYTTDGTNPSEGSTKYTAPFEMAVAATVKAIAIRRHYFNSSTSSQDITVPHTITVNGESSPLIVALDGDATKSTVLTIASSYPWSVKSTTGQPTNYTYVKDSDTRITVTPVADN